MAYITTQEVKEIRNELKKSFPNLKLSVTREHHSVLNVSIMEGNIDFGSQYQQLNHLYLREHKNKHNMILRMITMICNTKNFDHSDPQTDYFNVGYYFHLQIGKWDKGYSLKN